MQVFDLTKEDLVIRTYFTDQVIATKMSPLLDEQLYVNDLNKQLIRYIRKFVQKYSRRPLPQELVCGLADSGRSDDVRMHIIKMCNAEMDAPKRDYNIAMVESFYHERWVELILRKQAACMHDNDMQGVRELVPLLKEKLNFSLHLNLGLDLVDDIEEAKRRLDASIACIPSNIEDINRCTSQTNPKKGLCSGGYKRKTLTMYIGQPNVGKTMVMSSEAAYAVRNGFNVLYITLEIAEEQIWQRIVANILNIPQYDICDLSVEECRDRLLNAKIGDKLGILKVKSLTNGATASEIEDLVDSYEASTGKPVDLLVVDYIGIMGAGHLSRENNMYTEGKVKAEALRRIADDRNLACLTASQFNRSGYSSITAGIESIGGSSAYSETADLMITLTRDSILSELGMMANSIVKNRQGVNDYKFMTKVDFNTMRWYTPSKEDLERERVAREEFMAVQANLTTAYVPRQQLPNRVSTKVNHGMLPQSTEKNAASVSPGMLM